jgi:hypothetical protein
MKREKTEKAKKLENYRNSLENRLEKEVSSETKYQFLDENEGYNSKKIIDHYEDYQDAVRYYQTIQKDPKDERVWRKAGKLLNKNELFYFNNDRTPRDDLKEFIDEDINSISKYAKKNSSKIYNKLKTEDYGKLVQKVPLYLIEEKKHDEFVVAINELKKLNQMQGNANEMYEYFKKIISKESRSAQISFARHGKNDLEFMFEQRLLTLNQKVSSMMYDENKKLKGKFLKNVFKDSLAEARKELEKENYSKSEIEDIWESVTRPYWFALFEMAYEKEKKDEDISSKKEKRNDRRSIRRSKNMNF